MVLEVKYISISFIISYNCYVGVGLGESTHNEYIIASYTISYNSLFKVLL